jgi:predicted Zn-dependent peptidase
MVFSYVGALPLDKVIASVSKHMHFKRKSKKSVLSSAVRYGRKTKKMIVERNTAHDHYISGGKAYSAHDSNRFALFLMNNILGGPGMSSRLNMNIREKYGYTYQIESGFHTFSDTGLFHIYFATETGFFKKCLELVKKETDKLRNQRISDARLASYKYQLKGQIALGQENRAGFMLNNARNVLLYDRPLDLDYVMSKIDLVSSSDIMDVANNLLQDEFTSSLHYKSDKG